MEDKNLDRHLDLSSKLIEMGKALIKEGREINDYSITQTGGFLILVGGVILEVDDVFIFGQLCSMFSAKKLVDRMAASNDEAKPTFNGMSYADFIKYLKTLKDNNQEPPVE